MCRVHAPPVVGKHVEYAQDKYEECSRPFGLETDGDHNASGETENGNENTNDTPLSLEDESEEKEDKQYTASKKEAIQGW
jgi:hypothetical protein